MDDRITFLRSDALRSMLLIVGSFLLLWWAYSVPKNAPQTYESDPSIGKARRIEAVAGIACLILVDLFTVTDTLGKRISSVPVLFPIRSAKGLWMR